MKNTHICSILDLLSVPINIQNLSAEAVSCVFNTLQWTSILLFCSIYKWYTTLLTLTAFLTIFQQCLQTVFTTYHISDKLYDRLQVCNIKVCEDYLYILLLWNHDISFSAIFCGFLWLAKPWNRWWTKKSKYR